MQNIIIDKPYRFVPPVRGTLWSALFRSYLARYLWNAHGIGSWDLAGMERLQASIDAGHGILLAPNHCRPCDPMVVGLVARQLRTHLHVMASWHLFMQNPIQSWLLPRLGVFSLYREGLDRESLKCAIQILTDARRPLVLFAEGVISRTNDRLNNLMDGLAFMARSAAKQRAALDPPGKVVVHPVAIRYFLHGDAEATLAPVLEEIERRLSWQPLTGRPMPERIIRIGGALLVLKEIEHFGEPQTGAVEQRLAALVDRLLVPLEEEWLKGRRQGDVVSRIKPLRAAILPEMVAGEIDEAERARRWRQLADTYLAQQVAFYPPEYFGPHPTPEQMMETVERFEEDLTDTCRIHRPIHAVIEVGDAIEVSPTRDRSAAADPLMGQLRERLEAMLAGLKERRP